jgi:hypothetical protein
MAANNRGGDRAGNLVVEVNTLHSASALWGGSGVKALAKVSSDHLCSGEDIPQGILNGLQ